MPVLDREKERAIVVRGRERGMSDDQIKQAVLNFRSQGSAPAVEEPKQPGVGKQVVQSLAQPFLQAGSSMLGLGQAAGRLGAAGGALIAGNDQRAYDLTQKAFDNVSRERDFGYLGKAYPVAAAPGMGSQHGVKGVVEGAKDIIGTGAQLGAYLAPAPAVTGKAAFGAFKTGGMAAAKPILGQAVRQGATLAGSAGFLASGGHALKTADNLGEGLVETGIGTALGAGLGAALPLASFGSRVGAYKAVEGVKSGAAKLAGALGGKPYNAMGVKDDYAARLANKTLRTPLKAYERGQNPGSQLVDELKETGQIPGSKKALAEMLRKANSEKYPGLIDDILDDPALAAKHLNRSDYVNLMDDRIKEAADTGQPILVKRLKEIRDAFMYVPDEAGNPSATLRPNKLTLREANAIKTATAKKASYTGQAYDSEASKAARELARALKEGIENQADDAFAETGQLSRIGSTKAINRRWGGLIQSEKALEKAMAVANRNNVVSLGDMTSGGAGAVLGAATAGGPGAVGVAGTAVALRRAAESTPVTLALAVALRGSGVSLQKLLAPGGPALIATLPVVNRIAVQRILQAVMAQGAGQVADQTTQAITK